MTEAKWIWHKGKYDCNEYVDFKKDVVFSSVNPDAEIKISADTEYVLSINGELVGYAQYDDYPEAKVYDTYKIAKYLKEGENSIEINGYYQGVASLQYAVGEKGLWFELENGDDKVVSDETVKCRICEKFKNGDMHKNTWQMGFSFEYDAAEGENEWENAIIKDVKTTLSPRPIKQMVLSDVVCGAVSAQGFFKRVNKEGEIGELMYHDYLSHRRFEEMIEGEMEFPLTITRKEEDGAYIIVDMGREIAGYFSMELTAETESRIDITCGEHLQDLRVRSKTKNMDYGMIYNAKAGHQTFTYYFKRIAGRYLQFHIHESKNMILHKIGVREAIYPLEQTGLFRCEDSLHNKIFDVCVNTLRLGMHEHFEDTPWREQALYAFDSRNQALSYYYLFNDYSFPRASLNLLGQRPREKGQIGMCSPSDIELVIPSFSFWWLLEMREYAEYSGDLSLAEEHWTTIENIIEYHISTCKNGIVCPPVGDNFWQFYEWTMGHGGYEGAGSNIEGDTQRYAHLYGRDDFAAGPYHLIFWVVFKDVLWMAEKIGRSDFISKYAPMLDEMKKAYQELFWDAEKQAFATYWIDGRKDHYAEFTQSIALYGGMCDDEQSKVIYDKLLNGNDWVQISLSYSIFKYEALLKHSRESTKFVFDDVAKKWGNMLYNNATSFWETAVGQADFEGAGSLCHGWSAIPAYLYMRYAAGITPDGIEEINNAPFKHFKAEGKMKNGAMCVEK